MPTRSSVLPTMSSFTAYGENSGRCDIAPRREATTRHICHLIRDRSQKNTEIFIRREQAAEKARTVI
eukprot:scaffold3359_cov123-Cylindrotheca_fusiformis.AAC.20